MTLTVGDEAPDFTAPDEHDSIHALGEYEGRWLLLYFYPEDDTPGCTTEACGFRDAFDALKEKVAIVGVSADSSESHRRFIQKYSLPFTLLADTNKKIIDAYGANGLFFKKRVSFLIDPQGIIRKIYDSVKPEQHAQEILRDINLQNI